MIRLLNSDDDFDQNSLPQECCAAERNSRGERDADNSVLSKIEEEI